MNPCIPKNFGDFTITRTFRGVEYNIEVKNPDNIEKGVKELIVDGQSLGQTTVIPYDASKKQVSVTVQMVFFILLAPLSIKQILIKSICS